MTKIVPIHDPSISAPDIADALEAENFVNEDQLFLVICRGTAKVLSLP
jgi:hypothetical protein